MTTEFAVIKVKDMPKVTRQRRGGIYVQAVEKLKTLPIDEVVTFPLPADVNSRSVTAALYSAAVRKDMLISVSIHKDTNTVYVFHRDSNGLKKSLVDATLGPSKKTA